MFTYNTNGGVCAYKINIEVENDIIQNVEFYGGCDGYIKGIKNLVCGMNIDDVITKLKGINCRGIGTSCPDQLAQALEKFKKNSEVV